MLKVNPVARSLFAVAAVVVLATGITFAALNSQAKLTGNTISATPGLQLSIDGGATYGSNIQGFDFNVTPGDTVGVSKQFKLKNTTGSLMALSLRVPDTVTFTGGTVDGAKVHVSLTCSTPTLSLASDLDTLSSGEVAITGTLAAANDATCSMKATMDSDAITSGSSVTSDSFDLRFTGV